VDHVIENAKLIDESLLVLFFKKEQKAILFAKRSKNSHPVIVDNLARSLSLPKSAG
jgi:hypothetical protein